MSFNDINELSDFNIIVEVSFGLDIIMRFFHAYKDPLTYEVVTDIRKIARNYLL